MSVALAKSPSVPLWHSSCGLCVSAVWPEVSRFDQLFWLCVLSLFCVSFLKLLAGFVFYFPFLPLSLFGLYSDFPGKYLPHCFSGVVSNIIISSYKSPNTVMSSLVSIPKSNFHFSVQLFNFFLWFVLQLTACVTVAFLISKSMTGF